MNDDTISRRAAIDEFYHIKCNLQMMDDTHTADKMMHGLYLAENAVKLLPSAQRKGKWIYLTGLDAFECSVCGRQMVRNIFDYCPWCGAEMKGEEDEAD